MPAAAALAASPTKSTGAQVCSRRSALCRYAQLHQTRTRRAINSRLIERPTFAPPRHIAVAAFQSFPEEPNCCRMSTEAFTCFNCKREGCCAPLQEVMTSVQPPPPAMHCSAARAALRRSRPRPCSSIRPPCISRLRTLTREHALCETHYTRKCSLTHGGALPGGRLQPGWWVGAQGRMGGRRQGIKGPDASEAGVAKGAECWTRSERQPGTKRCGSEQGTALAGMNDSLAEWPR